jgi:hypothetical protein
MKRDCVAPIRKIKIPIPAAPQAGFPLGSSKLRGVKIETNLLLTIPAET